MAGAAIITGITRCFIMIFEAPAIPSQQTTDKKLGAFVQWAMSQYGAPVLPLP